jgi:O-antigen/teichoic acid export membrane protein
VGIYNAACRIVVFLYFVPNALQRTLLPRLSSQFISSPTAYGDTLEKALRLALVIALPASLGLYMTAPGVVGLVFSEQFREAGPVLAILALSIPFYYIRVIMNSALYAAGREKVALIVYAIGTAMNAIVNMILISRYDCVGAAVGTLFAEAILCIAYCWLIARDFHFRRFFIFGGQVALVCLLMGAVLILLPSESLALRVGLGGAVYLVGLFGLRIVDINLVKPYVGLARRVEI